MAKLVVDEQFETEADEARWWADNQELVAQKLEEAAIDGTLGRGTVARKGLTPTTTIRLSTEDILRARTLAQRKGLRYQTYLKMLIHEALGNEEERPKGSEKEASLHQGSRFADRRQSQ